MANLKNRRRRWIIFTAAVLLVAGGVTGTILWRKRERPILIQVDKVQRRNLTELVVANGKVQPVTQVKISPEVSGEIIELPVKEGQDVKKGDLLLKIKPDAYIANRRSAEASYQASVSGRDLSEANLRKAESEYKRSYGLYAAQLVSDSTYEDAKTTLEVAKASFATARHQVDVAKAALDRALEELSKTTIYSPLTGTVSKLNSQLGERVVGTAMMTGTEVMTLADLNEMEARVDIGEVDVVLIAAGQVARLEVDAFRDRKFSGTVTEIANSSKGFTMGSGGSSQEATKFEVRIRIAEKEVFRPGMSVTAEVETRYRTNVLSVPIQSVTTRLPKKKDAKGAGADACTNAASTAQSSAGASQAETASGGKREKKETEGPKPIEVVFGIKGDRAVLLPVKRGISDDAYMEILEGLREGQEVVSGSYKAISRDLEDEKRVKLDKAKADSANKKESS